MAHLRLAPAAVETTALAGGGAILRSPAELGPYPANLCAHLRRWALDAPDRIFLAERDREGSWRHATYARALHTVERLARALLGRGLCAERPVMILSENSLHHGLLALACCYVGIPVAPISPAYSLVSRDHAKLRHVFGVVRPGMVYASDGRRFAPALAALDLGATEIVVDGEPPPGIEATPFAALEAPEPGPSVEEAFSRVGPDTVAKILFTSGSTDVPKGVINTHRMLCSNQQAIAQAWPFLEDRPPVLLDWLPWNHTFGGNKNFNLVLRNGGSLFIDGGKPVAGAIETTVANLRDLSPTISFNVPRGYDALLPHLERDPALRDAFFRDLDLIFYAAAALPQPLWERLEALCLASRGAMVFMASGWGTTETAPAITLVHYPIERAGAVGLPLPGNDLKLVPNAGKLEMRVKGPGVTPGYFRRDDLTRQAFDSDGFYETGDAGRLADPADPVKGLLFDGRVSEDFKLTTGTWVHVSGVRLGALEATAPLLLDAVVTGHDRDYVGLLAWLNAEACSGVAPGLGNDPQALAAASAVVDAVRKGLRARNGTQSGSATRVGRFLFLTEPPSLDANEVTDKGYINQRATLARRASLVEKLYAEPPPDGVVVL